jgi:PknH-like extracellular domain
MEAQPEGYALSDSNCLSLMNPASDSAYRGSRYKGVYGLVGQDDQHPTVDVAAVAFPDAPAAASLADAQARTWKDCSDKTLTATIPEKPISNWMVVPLTRSYGVVVSLRMQEGGQGFGCARGIAARANVVADVSVCDLDQANIERQTSKVTNMILDRIH